jgi:FAD binding domain-containing protein/berberine-like enzyme
VRRRQLLERAAALPLAGALAACSGSGTPSSSTRGTAPATSTAGPTLAGLASQLRGPLLLPGTAHYANASVISNERYSGVHPKAIARAVVEADVAACVRFAARSALPFTMRCGGHSYAGYSTNAGLVCDVRRLNAISLAADRKSVTVGAGVLAIDLITALAGHGLAVPTGSCPTVGISGLALGGGVGFAARTMGATCDNILAVRIVTADGRVRVANPSTNADLLWACRGGGGGNFGAVTALTLATHPVSTAAYGFCDFPWSQAAAALAAWQGLAPHGPDGLYLICAIETGTSSPQVRVFGQLLGGSEAALRSAMAPITAVAGASLSTGSGTYLDVQQIWAGCAGESAAACRTIQPSSFAARSAYFATPLGSAGAGTIVRAIEARQAAGVGSGAVLLDPYGGALNRVAADATAFVHRDQLYSAQMLAYWGAAGQGPAATAWLDGLASSLAPHTSGQAYQNYIDPGLHGWQQAYYATNLPRLRSIKRTWDPDRVFRFRQGIPPAA